jgi:hypothetical protein
VTISAVLGSARRRRSPVTMPGYHAGRAPRNKGIHYPADPPTVEEIVSVMRQAAAGRHGSRLRALIVVLWRGGLRVQEALALGERDLDAQRGSLLVRNGKGGRRREIGMDRLGLGAAGAVAWGARRTPGGAAVLHHRWPDSRAALVKRGCPLPAPPARSRGRSPTAICATPTPPRPRRRIGPRRRAAQRHPTAARPREPRHDLDLSARHRHRGDHRDGSRQAAPMMSATAGLRL